MLVGSLMLSGVLASAPAVQEVPDALSCPDCTIVVDTVAVLGSESGPDELYGQVQVVGGPRGTYWVFAYGTMPKVFDANGVFVRSFGRPGEGPGELQSPGNLIAIPGDSTLIMEGSRHSLFDPDGTHVRSTLAPLLGATRGIVLEWPSSVVMNALDPRPGREERPLHLVDYSGAQAEVVRSFGREEERELSSIYIDLPRRMTPAQAGGYWTLEEAEYDLTRWSAEHEPDLTIVRRPEWFPGASDMRIGNRDTPPSPGCKGVSEDAQGRVWAFCQVASPDFQAAWDAVPEQDSSRGAAETPRGGPEVEYHHLYHTYVEVIDPNTRRVLARHTIDQGIMDVLPGQRAALLDISPLGFSLVHIVRFRLEENRDS